MVVSDFVGIVLLFGEMIMVCYMLMNLRYYEKNLELVIIVMNFMN